MSQGEEAIPDHRRAMWRLVESLPDQLEEGYRRGREISAPVTGTVLVSGMGGSGISGEIAAALAARHAGCPVLPVRDFELPSWAKSSSLAIFVSYSGNTAETLSAYREAGTLGMRRLVITSGGELGTRAEAEGVPRVLVPGGHPPRASLGWLLGALLGALSPVFPGGRIDPSRTVVELRGLRPALLDPRGTPGRIVEILGERPLWVYAPERLAVVGRRWKTQSEENTKRLSHFDTIPELLHNALVAWDPLWRGSDAAPYVALIRGAVDSADVTRRIDYLERVLERQGIPHGSVRLSSPDPLTEILEGIWVGDILSLRWAERLGIDPFPVVAIDRMKATMTTVPR